MNNIHLLKHAGLALTFIFSSVLLTRILPNNIGSTRQYLKYDASTLGSFDVKVPEYKFGFALDTFNVERKEIQHGESLISILENFLERNKTYELINKSKEIFNPRIIQPGKEIFFLKNKKNNAIQYMVYEPDVFKYIIFDFNNVENIKLIKRPIFTSLEVASGVMEGSLWETIRKYDMDTDLAEQMENAMECAFDMSRARKGDIIKLVYEKRQIEGKEVGAGKLLSAFYKGALGEKYIFYFDNGTYKGYFDEDGRPMKKSYLQAPLKYAKISSKFSVRRLHPILKVVIPHFGTDYAAPYGTPIISVSDGTVVERGYSSGNGNYVKIKHDKTYATQYLHMSKFASNTRKGQKVKQGQTIGFVGSTGLATGPHVCFRFWKNGRQVDPKRQKLPTPNPIPSHALQQFKIIRNEMINKLASVGRPLPGQNVVKMSEQELDLYSGKP